MTTCAERIAAAIAQERARVEQLRADAVRRGNATKRAKGVHIGRKPIVFDHARLAQLRAAGWTWKQCAAQLGISASLAQKVGSKMATEGV